MPARTSPGSRGVFAGSGGAAAAGERKASIDLTLLARDCALKSGEVSMRTFSPDGNITRMDARVRLFLGSTERHTSQSQPMTGTPVDVPLPSMRILICLWNITLHRPILPPPALLIGG